MATALPVPGGHQKTGSISSDRKWQIEVRCGIISSDGRPVNPPPLHPNSQLPNLPPPPLTSMAVSLLSFPDAFAGIHHLDLCPA